MIVESIVFWIDFASIIAVVEFCHVDHVVSIVGVEALSNHQHALHHPDGSVQNCMHATDMRRYLTVDDAGLSYLVVVFTIIVRDFIRSDSIVDCRRHILSTVFTMVTASAMFPRMASFRRLQYYRSSSTRESAFFRVSMRDSLSIPKFRDSLLFTLGFFRKLAETQLMRIGWIDIKTRMIFEIVDNLGELMFVLIHI